MELRIKGHLAKYQDDKGYVAIEIPGLKAEHLMIGTLDNVKIADEDGTDRPLTDQESMMLDSALDQFTTTLMGLALAKLIRR